MNPLITDFSLPSIPIPLALAAVATIGYLVGLRARRRLAKRPEAKAVDMIPQQRSAQRTAIVAKELESIAEQLRRRLAEHHRSVATFQERVTEFCQSRPQSEWLEIAREAKDILKPTIKLASELAQAYDGIRRQSIQLVAQVPTKTDSLTGISSRDAMVEMLDMHVAMGRRFERPLSIAMFDIDNFRESNERRGRIFGDHALRSTARLINETIRDTDAVARFGGEEFVAAMPGTNLDEALMTAERLRESIERQIGITVSVGVAEAIAGETTAELLARADVAVNSAKAAGRNRVFGHAGDEIVAFGERIDAAQEIGMSARSPRDAVAIG
jgi:diguanylate cyclase (GGDEF)-like protein